MIKTTKKCKPRSKEKRGKVIKNTIHFSSVQFASNTKPIISFLKVNWNEEKAGAKPVARNRIGNDATAFQINSFGICGIVRTESAVSVLRTLILNGSVPIV
jgi:hypothetical protein